MLELFEMYNLKEMPLSTEIFLSCSILQLTFYAIATTQQRRHGFVILSQQMYHIGVLIVGLSSLLLLNEDLVSFNFLSSNNFIINDYLGFAAKLVVCLTTVLFLMLITTSYEDKTVQNNFEYTVLILISVFGLLLLCSSNDLITAYLSIELQSVAFYIMAAFKKNSIYSIESGLKYFVIGSLSSAFFLFGSAIIYGCVGSLNFDDIRMFLSLSLTFFSESSSSVNPSNSDINSILISLKSTSQLDLSSNAQILQHILNNHFDSLNAGYRAVESSNFNLDFIYLGFIFLCLSLFIKLSLAPFHFWSLDVYEGSPNTTTIFFAVVPKIGLFVLLIRICYASFYSNFSSAWQSYFLIIAVLSIFIGSVGGLEQRKLKTLLAYSSISHTGYLLLSFSSSSLEGMSMMLYYLAIYMVSSLCFWSVYLFINPKKKNYFKKQNKELGDLVLLRESNPLLALILAMTLFSIAGIPPIVGFLAKIGVFLEVIKSSAYLISLIGILCSVASTFYYIRIIKILYFENILVGKLYENISTKKSLLISLLALSLIVLCIDPSIIYFLFEIASLLTGF
uniref:NADH dehydrogenase subunit 2 n=1 Tax=Nitzschia dissipata TaxID=303402 RepID=UPI00202907EF|nr:NADH dehydrogenase subunit 2 [Nitzschia dissipata]QYB23074.1 NADH dehydrogenase subunit 2 [Nitzschia dissipata]